MSSGAEQHARDPDQLHRQLAERDRLIAEQQRQIRDLQGQLDSLKEQIVASNRARFGQRSERGAYLQGSLFADGQAVLTPADEPSTAEEDKTTQPQQRSGKERKKPARQGASRGVLPDDLPREPKRHDYTEEQRRELQERYGPLEPVSVEITETLEYRPGSFYVLRHERPNYAVTDESGERTIISPDKPTAPIPGAQAGVTLIAHTILSKVDDKLPLNRIADQFARDGMKLPRQRLDDYLISAAQVLAPVAGCIHEDALNSPIVHGDDTTLPQREKGRRQTRTGRVWGHAGRGREDGLLPVSFRYTPHRRQETVLETFLGFTGYLQGDAFAGYLSAERREPGLTWVGCWAHARRYFEKVVRNQRRWGRAHEVMKLITALFQLESRLEDLAPEEIRAERQRRALPILARLHAKLETMATYLAPKSDLGKAVAYTLNHWQGLVRYTEDGRLDITNNYAERLLRGLCVGRKNWNFAGSREGAEAMMVLLTIVETCKQNGVNVRRYLEDVLERIQDYPANRIRELLPYHWSDPQAA